MILQNGNTCSRVPNRRRARHNTLTVLPNWSANKRTYLFVMLENFASQFKVFRPGTLIKGLYTETTIRYKRVYAGGIELKIYITIYVTK